MIVDDEEGRAIPEPGCTDWEAARVEETINRLKLNEHTNLAEERRKVWQKVSTEIDGFIVSKSRCNQPGNPAAKEKLEAHMKAIRQLSRDSSELSAVAKCCAIFRNDRQLARLVS